ncbi:MAG: hypothetical protein Kow00124_06110 [Anaerolineae bacterium]
MRQLAKQFAAVFFLGFIALAFAFGYGAITGTILSDQPFPVALRAFGIGLMAAGMSLWVAIRRDEAGKPELNPLFYFTAVSGMLLLLAALLFYNQPFMPLLAQAGVIVALAGLVIALLVMIIAPAFPKPVTVTWPEGGEPQPPVHEHHSEPAEAAHEAAPAAEAAHSTPAAPAAPAAEDDLTRIEGIGPRIESILREAGISTFGALAATAPEAITALLKEAGFKAPFDATTWPKQAELAARGDWDALARLQDELSGGRQG